MLPQQKPDILSKSSVKVKFYPRATTEDITDHLWSAMRKKPYAIIIHTGTNDLTNKVNNDQTCKKYHKDYRENENWW